MSKRLNKTIKWDKLDNTANLFPVIVSENVSNVYRISVTLTEEHRCRTSAKGIGQDSSIF